MITDQASVANLEFRVELERHIKAPIDQVFDALLDQLGPRAETPDSNPMSMKIEPFPGGRWFRDLGEGNGHHWAHVQAIKRPELLELTGPLFMSQPVCNNVQYRLTETDGTTTLKLVHAAFGLIPEGVVDGMPKGWTDQLDRIEGRFN